MGNCCSNDAQEEGTQETNMSKNAMTSKTRKQSLNNKYPIYTIIKAQALIRGFLTRKMVKKIYGFEMSHGLLLRGTVHIEMDPEKLEE